MSALQHWQHLIAASAARPVHDRGLCPDERTRGRRCGPSAHRPRYGPERRGSSRPRWRVCDFVKAVLRDGLESDDLARHLLLVGRKLGDAAGDLLLAGGDDPVDAARYLFLIGGNDAIDAARYLFVRVGNGRRPNSRAEVPR